MGVLLLLRHGQGSMGTADYDRLSELGCEQARLAGARLARTGLSINQVWCGGLTRQQETARLVLAELGRPRNDLRTDVRLDEYDPAGVLGASDPFATATTAKSPPRRPAHRPGRRAVAGPGPRDDERQHHQAHHRLDRDQPADLQRPRAPGG